MSDQKKTVVIVGAGFAGVRVFNELKKAKNFHLICIEPKEFFDSIPSSVDNMVTPTGANKLLVPYAKDLAQVTKRGYVTAIKPNQVTLSNGETVNFDYCVISTGSTYGALRIDPTAVPTKQERIDFLIKQKESMASSNHLIIVGGGSVGVEAASALAETFPDKDITLLAGTSRLLPTFSQKATEYTASWFEKNAKNVKIVYDEKVVDWGSLGKVPAEATLSTDKGTTLSGFVIKCIGFSPGTKPFASSFTDSQLTPSGALKVSDTFQVTGLPNVFAAGDVCATPSPFEKTANYADYCGIVVANNIKALESDGKIKMETFPEGFFGGPAPFLSGATLGKKDGVMQIGPDELQTGGGVAFMHGLFAKILTSNANGSWFYAWLLNFMKNMFKGQIKAAAKKLAEASK